MHFGLFGLVRHPIYFAGDLPCRRRGEGGRHQPYASEEDCRPFHRRLSVKPDAAGRIRQLGGFSSHGAKRASPDGDICVRIAHVDPPSRDEQVTDNVWP